MRLAFAVVLLLVLLPRQTPRIVSDDRRPDPVLDRCLSRAPEPARLTDNEAYGTADPSTPSRVVAVWQTQHAGKSVIQSARSDDAGETWSVPRVVPVNGCAGGPVPGATRASDPWAAFGRDGRLYVSGIAWEPDANDGDSISVLVVSASPDGGRSWEPPVAAAVAPSRVAFDNLAVTADPTRRSTLYLATTRAESPDSATYFGRLGFARSEDGGKTWTPMRPITPAVNQDRIGAPQIVVDPRSGRLYAVFHRQGPTGSFVGVMASDDRGDHWSTMVAAAPHVRGPRLNHAAGGRRFVMAEDILQAAVSPLTGYLVITYADARRAPGARFGVSAVVSPDGRQWSSPHLISDPEGADHSWLPAIAMAPSGEIGISFFSAGFGATKDSTGMTLVRRRFRVSGLELVPADRMGGDGFPLFWPGDYQGLVVSAGRFVSIYGREGDIASIR